MKKIILLTIAIFLLNLSSSYSNKNDELYKKIDLFGEVLDKIKN